MTEGRGLDRNLSPLLADIFAFILLHDLSHEIPHGFRSLILNLPGGVGVGAEGEAGIVVAQHTADGFDVYTVLEGYCGEVCLRPWSGMCSRSASLRIFSWSFATESG